MCTLLRRVLTLMSKDSDTSVERSSSESGLEKNSNLELTKSQQNIKS